MQGHGSTSSDVANTPSGRLPDYISLNPTNQEGPDANTWTVSESSSSSGPAQPNPGHIGARSDCRWHTLMKSCPEPPSSVLSLTNHGASSSSFTDPFGPSSDSFDPIDHHSSRKRKAVELTTGQSSSGVGSADMFQSRPISDPTIPRLGLSIGDNLLAVRQQVDPLLPHINNSNNYSSSNNNTNNNNNVNNNNNRESDVSGLRLNPPPENTLSGQPSLRVPALRRNFQSTSRWSRGSTSRPTRSPNLVISGDRVEPDLNPENLVFPPPSNIITATQTEPTDGGTDNPASYRARLSSGSSSSYNPRRLSAFLRRSLLSAAGSEGDGEQNGNIFPGLNGSSSSQDVGAMPGQHHQPYSRSFLLGRHLEGAFGLPSVSRAVTPGSEGRGRLVSEIRNVLDLMRRGESLRFEDVMILDQSVFYGIADNHDRHREMRLDIDNMSYEELLALEEHIGNVSTGLTEETILKHLKQKPYVVEMGQPIEPCSVCQEEYTEGDDLGTLECGHDFHHGCIKQWLQHKNLCPICKSTGFVAK
ncbi:E3 ubiquitin-protein ligase MBR2-like [Bidens hawaiensis]|uniref:E3 ubiquitin-protein ligase MBR2-like n=1 Tax=Bidens hawaiensis TaxID=980011 RepID=UPI00404A7E40